MSVVVPKGRKYLCADALFRLIRNGFDTLPDHRCGDAEVTFSDTLMSAFAMFSLKSPSLLAFDKQRAAGNLHTIYGIERVPCDTSMRAQLDPVLPESLRPLFKGVLRQLQRGKALEPMAFFTEHYLLALDGTGYFSSKTIHCASCLHKHHRNGSTTYYHQMLGAAIIHPDFREVIPFMPEPIVKQDGTEKNDGERHAAKRFKYLAKSNPVFLAQALWRRLSSICCISARIIPENFRSGTYCQVASRPSAPQVHRNGGQLEFQCPPH